MQFLSFLSLLVGTLSRMALVVVPELLSAAASDLAGIGSAVESAVSAAQVPTTGVAAAAADEVSAAAAALFSEQGAAFQAVSVQAAAFHAQFVQLLSGGAASYAQAEASNLLAMVNAAAEPWFGRPLIGDGRDGYTDANGFGTRGQDGGLLWGNGGRGGDSTAPSAIGGKGGGGGFLWGNGGAGGNGGPGGAEFVGPVLLWAQQAGTGGAGGSATGWFGNGGAGGAGGTSTLIVDGNPSVLPFTGQAGKGGNAGLFVGTGGAAGSGFVPTGGGRDGNDSISGEAWPY